MTRIPKRCLVALALSALLLGGCDLASVGGTEDEGGSRGTFGHGSHIGTFWNTYYYLVSQSSYPGSGYPIYSKGCNVIVSSTYAFYKAAQMEGSARLNSGQVINYAGGCSCGGSSRSCFKLLGASQPWGQGATSNALIPLRSIAVDPGSIKLGSTLYIKQWDGVQIPAHDGLGGFVHDGCFRADDTGGAINGNHYDFFAGTKGMWKALESIFGTKSSFSVYHGGTTCAYVAGLQPGQQGQQGAGSNDGSNNDGSTSDGWGDCFYGGERGVCQEDSKPCAGEYKGSLCPGPNNVRCCMPPSQSDGDSGGSNDSGGSTDWGTCSYAARTGTCQDSSQACAGGYQSGLCPGPSSVKCCLPAWGSCSYGGQTGTCQLTTSSCSSGYKSGLCPGPSSVKCCLD